MSNPAFLIIGSETTVRNTRWIGPVVVSRDAIYCVLNSKRSEAIATSAGAALGGVLGFFLAKAISGKSGKNFYHPNVSPLRYLPSELRTRRPKGLLFDYTDDTPVLTIERKATSLVQRTAKLNNTLELDFDNEQVRIVHGLFSGAKAKKALSAMGWPLNWKGEKFNMDGIPTTQA